MDYEVTAPDGRRFVVTAPEGATQEQVLSYAQQNYNRPQQPPSGAPSNGIPGPRQYTAGEVPGAALGNLPRGAGEFYGEMAEMVTSPVQTAKSLGQLALGAMRRANPLLARASDALYKPEFAEQSDAAFNAAVDHYTKTYGSWENAKAYIAENPVHFLADVSMLFGGGAAAARGAGMTRTGRVLQAAETATNPLTPIIAPIQAAGRGAGAATERVYQSTDPRSAFYREISEGREPQLIAEMRGQGVGAMVPAIPGAELTPAQLAARAGAARFAATADVATAKKFPSEVAERAAAQDRALMAEMRSVSGAPADPLYGRAGAVETATEARGAQAAPLFARAERDILPGDATIQRLMERPSMAAAIRRGAEIAAEESRPFSLRPPEPPTPSGLLDAQGRPVPPRPAPPPEYSILDLQYVKRGIDDLIKDPMSGLGTKQRNAIEATRRELLDWIDSQSEAYKTARSAFTTASEGVEKLKVARSLEQSLASALSGGPERAQNFARAVQEAPETMRLATGNGRYAYLAELFGPDTRKIEAILTDLRRQEQANKLIDVGRRSVPNIEKVFTSASAASVPPFMDRVFTIARTILNKFEGKLNEKMAMQIAEELMDPAKTAAALERAQTFAARQQRAGSAARRPFEATAGALRSPAARAVPQATNAMSPRSRAEDDIPNMFAPYFAR